jgi:hypothetical protein
MKKTIIGVVIALVVLIGAGALYWFVFRKDLSDSIVIPYIAHQKPHIDPHVPSAIPLADKLDDVLFDGLFNGVPSPSGILYQDGLGEFVSVDPAGLVIVRLKPNRKWHSSYRATMEKKKITVTPAQEIDFTAEDLRFTLKRIQKLGSLSPDFILVSQALPDFEFTGPDANGEIRFQMRGDRTWVEADIKEILSFKIIPAAGMENAEGYNIGTGPYLRAGEYEDVMYCQKMPSRSASITSFILKPFIDNSTYTTELKNKNINVLLSTPFGAVSPILGDSTQYFYKSSIATCFFALMFNNEKLSIDQRKALRKLVNNRMIMERFFKSGTQQQRHIANYKGAGDNYDEYLNYSVFPSTSVYIDAEYVTPVKEQTEGDIGTLPDTVRIQTCLNYDFREELSQLVEILNDPSMFHGKIKATAVSNDEIGRGAYDAVLGPVTGYRSNFLYDLYNVFLREPDFSTNRINLVTSINADGKQAASDQSFSAGKNFFRLDLAGNSPELADVKQLLEFIYKFMASSEVSDKQHYAKLIDDLESKLALGGWLFSLPSLAYLSTQFDAASIDMYGKASQLSTVEKWKESLKKK